MILRKREDPSSQPGRVEASGDAAVAVGGSVHAPITVTNQTIVSPVREVPWPVYVGVVPELASAFQLRQGLREQIQAARGAGTDVVLAQPEPTARATRILAGGGGVGKSQLAAWFAHQAVEDPDMDLVVWVAADSPEQIIATYARAARRVGADLTGDATGDAAAFVEWLRATARAWLVVLDDITDPADLAGWWPPVRPAGWTLATTRLHDAALASSGRQRIDVGVYTPPESVAYLTTRLTEARLPYLVDDRAADLAAALGHLPLALSHAAAFMANQDESCTDYLARYTSGQERLPDLMPADSDPDGYGRPVAVTLLLALDAADSDAPAGLARPALAAASMLDPTGHPETLWATDAMTGYLAGHRIDQDLEVVTADQARKAIRLLHRYALITHTRADPVHTVRVHALTARAMRETLTDPAPAARTAADALLAIWPDNDHASTELTATLQANVATLHSLTGDSLWHPGVHPLLYRAGNGLLRAGLHSAAVTYWRTMANQAERLLGTEHSDTVTVRGNLATSYRQAGRTSDAIAISEQVLADFERLLGSEHPNTLTTRGNLAAAYQQAGRTSDAITIFEQVTADFDRLLGAEHPNTLTARANLAFSYQQAGRTSDAITIFEQVAADRDRLLGAEHPTTLSARANLASSYRQAGRTGDAITIFEQVAAHRERLLGSEHPNTLTTRGNLASCYQQAGRTSDAIVIFELVTADFERLLGLEHPHTLTARANLAFSYRHAGRTGDAITIFEQVAADRDRLLGPEHPDTLTTRANLAICYQQAGRTDDAIAIFEQVFADFERLLGTEHPGTVTTRGNLASAYRQAGRTGDAITLSEQVVADSERLLGTEHPTTLTARGNLASCYQQAGRTGDAIAVSEQVLADRERLLGPEHPDTLAFRDALRALKR